MKRKSPPKVCPVCGEDVPPKALACPECGSCHNTGWKEGAEIHDGLDLPDNEFEYESYLKREFGGGVKAPGVNVIWWVTGMVLLLILALGLMRWW
jgi:hypothetical protein